MIRHPRQKHPDHLAWLRQLPCCVCLDDTSTEAAHVRMAAPKAGKRPTGKGEKPSDIFAVPLCGRHHREQHEGSEPGWWASKGQDPIFIALALWAHSGDYEIGCQIVREHSETAFETTLRNTTAWSG